MSLGCELVELLILPHPIASQLEPALVPGLLLRGTTVKLHCQGCV